ncbi:hypothetical protein [Pseudonocardia humida]|uniref:Uncharacterized protein n=1 Tax=Pseudonocardia humida TaxID=2800819 RepID=A0ABT0ZV93_9PSEU|nr:hypothetical protein [Pseudonocardia humida]MCO1654654.1 hypothetical protein [Pseudonocardia humida]
MKSDALIAALGVDAVAAVRGYRTAVVTDAARRGLVLTSSALTGPTRTAAAGTRVLDPVDIRLVFARGGVRADLSGRLLQWGPATGWSTEVPADPASVRYYAGPDAVPLSLVPTAPQILDWVVRGVDAAAARHPAPAPDGVELAADPAALRRLIDFIDPPRLAHAHQVLRVAGRAPHSPHFPRPRRGRPS